MNRTTEDGSALMGDDGHRSGWVEAQWEVAGGAPGAIEAVHDDMKTRLKHLTGLTQETYQVHREHYLRHALQQVAALIEDAEWLRRVLIDEVNDESLIAQRATAELSGVAYTTVQRWNKDPLLAFLGDYGPKVPVAPEQADKRSTRHKK